MISVEPTHVLVTAVAGSIWTDSATAFLSTGPLKFSSIGSAVVATSVLLLIGTTTATAGPGWTALVRR